MLKLDIVDFVLEDGLTIYNFPDCLAAIVRLLIWEQSEKTDGTRSQKPAN